jgi:hypothetical protein
MDHRIPLIIDNHARQSNLIGTVYAIMSRRRQMKARRSRMSSIVSYFFTAQVKRTID